MPDMIVKPGKRYRVLVIDDEDSLRAYYQQTLARAFDVEGVGTVADAMLRLAKQPTVDAILMDLILPNGKGLSLINRFKKQTDVPITVISGHTDYTSEQVILAGAQEYLFKTDASASDIVHAVRNALARHQAQKIIAAASKPLEEAKSSLDDSISRLSTAIRDPRSPGKEKP